MKNYTAEAKKIVKYLKSKGIKSIDIDYATDYSPYYLSQQIRNDKVSEDHFIQIKACYDEFLKNPDYFKNIKHKIRKRVNIFDQADESNYASTKSTTNSGVTNIDELIAHQNKILQTISDQTVTVNKSTEITAGAIKLISENVSRQLEVLMSNSKDIMARVTGLYLKGESVSAVTLRSLARLEKKPEASLVYESDRMYADLSDKWTMQSNVAAEGSPHNS